MKWLISEGASNRNKEIYISKRAIAVLIEIRFPFTGFQLSFQTTIFGTKLKLTIRAKLEGSLYPGRLIIGCIFWFTGRWAYNREDLQATGVGGSLISDSLRYILSLSVSE